MSATSGVSAGRSTTGSRLGLNGLSVTIALWEGIRPRPRTSGPKPCWFSTSLSNPEQLGMNGRFSAPARNLRLMWKLE